MDQLTFLLKWKTKSLNFWLKVGYFHSTRTNSHSFLPLPSPLLFYFCVLSFLICQSISGQTIYSGKRYFSSKRTPVFSTPLQHQYFCNQKEEVLLYDIRSKNKSQIKFFSFFLSTSAGNFNAINIRGRASKQRNLPRLSSQVKKQKQYEDITVKEKVERFILGDRLFFSQDNPSQPISVEKEQEESNSPLLPFFVALTISIFIIFWFLFNEPVYATAIGAENFADLDDIFSMGKDLIDVQHRNIHDFLLYDDKHLTVIDSHMEMKPSEENLNQALLSFFHSFSSIISTSSTMTPSSSSPVIDFIFWKSFIAGTMAGVSRALSRIITFPLDTIKTRQQATILLKKSKEEKQGEFPFIIETERTTNEQKIERNSSLSNEPSSESVLHEKEEKKKYFVLVGKKSRRIFAKIKSMDKLFDGLAPMLLVAGPANAAFFVVYDYLLAITKWFLLSYPYPSPSSFISNEETITMDNLHEIPSFVFYAFFLPFVHSCAHSTRSSTTFSSTSSIGSSYVGLVASLIASLPSNMIRIPAEVTKQRVQTGFNSNFFQAGTNILNIEGWKGLYRGGKSQLMRELPFNAVQFVIFNQLKTFFLLHVNDYSSFQNILYSVFHSSAIESSASAGLLVTTVKLPLIVKAFCGASAASVASLLTQPLDTIKTYMMLSTDTENKIFEDTKEKGNQNKLYGSKESMKNTDSMETATSTEKTSMSILDTAKYITTNYGFQSLYLGALPRVGLCFIGGGTFFLAEETTKELLEGLKDWYI